MRRHLMQALQQLPDLHEDGDHLTKKPCRTWAAIPLGGANTDTILRELDRNRKQVSCLTIHKLAHVSSSSVVGNGKDVLGVAKSFQALDRKAELLMW
eukprot:CAMPEP_0115735152 /NCGR_PEP_ID=MMETSP0272-20121206/86568_1 /TAXON_ID=71861 /ORGANISM="Scrippsiella trochoidea, Strain CCMP3099" /LENGTH=96 /DNA_ID=CAMNT_0003179241 /DNA_START=85 /DNA_END=372 /DNA_ORIENTATION=-